MSMDKRMPVVGEVWRERRREYRSRTVEVLHVEEHGFVTIRSLTDYQGQPAKRRPKTAVRVGLWHKTFEPVS